MVCSRTRRVKTSLDKKFIVLDFCEKLLAAEYAALATNCWRLTRQRDKDTIRVPIRYHKLPAIEVG